MSFIKEIRHIGQVGGSLLRKAAPIVGLIPGVGTIAGAGLGALGSIAEGHRGLSGTLGSAAMGGLSGYGGSKLRALLAAKGASGTGQSMPNGGYGSTAPSSLPDGGWSDPSTGFGVGTPGSTSASGIDGWISKLGPLAGLIPKNRDGSYNLGGLLKGAAGIALPAAGAIQASKKAAEADKYRQKQIGLAESQWAAGAPLRTMGMAGLTDPRMADISSLLNRPRPNYTPVAP